MHTIVVTQASKMSFLTSSFATFGGGGSIVERSIDVATVNEQMSEVIGKALASHIWPHSVCRT